MKMKKLFDLLAKPLASTLLFVSAAGLILFSGIGGTRAALTYYSENYASRVQMYDIGVTLVENNENVSWRDYSQKGDGQWKEAKGELLSNMLSADEEFKLGKTYSEELKVTNSGTINQYVRVTVYKYWLNADGEKMRNLAPELIDLNLVNLDSDWILDESSSTSERTVLYYNKLLKAGESTPIFSDTLTIDGILASKVTETVSKDGEYTVVTTSYDYDGVTFMLEARVDAVQEHNGEDAILSAWGRHVSISDGNLQLVEGGQND